MASLIRFGVFELNLDTEELRKFGTLIKLPPQPFKVLALLASKPGKLVTRDHIQQQIWGEETLVDFEQGMNQCIKQIRVALNDSADTPRYIETHPRRGYRFIASVESSFGKSDISPALTATPVQGVAASPAGTTALRPPVEGASTAAHTQIVQTPVADEPVMAPPPEPQFKVPQFRVVLRSRFGALAVALLLVAAIIGGYLIWYSLR